LEWLVFDYKQKSGTSFLVEYTLKNPDRLDGSRISQFTQIVKTQVYSQFEILEINKGRWFVLENLHTGKTYKVYEKKGTTAIKYPGTIPGRIAKVDNRWYLVGANTVYFPITYTQRHKRYMRDLKITDYFPKHTVELLMNQDNHKENVKL